MISGFNGLQMVLSGKSFLFSVFAVYNALAAFMLFITKFFGNPRERHHLRFRVAELVVIQWPANAVDVQPRTPYTLSQCIKFALRFNQLLCLSCYQFYFGHHVHF